METPRNYSLRANGLAERAADGLARAGAIAVRDKVGPGDVLLFEPLPAQAHLAIASEEGVIHAHFAVGRVTEGPVDPAWSLRSAWRFGGER